MTRRTRARRRQRDSSGSDQRPFKQLVSHLPPIEVLDDEAIALIHNGALQVMAETGLEMWDSEARSILREAGAKVDEKMERVWFDPEMVSELIAHAPAEFTLHARDPQKHLRIGGNRIAFGAVGGPPFVSDLQQGRRPATIEDLKNFNKLIHMSDVLTLGGGHMVEPSDLNSATAHLDAAYYDIILTDKASRGNGFGTQVTSDSVAMWALGHSDGSLDADDALSAVKDKVILMTVINANSPLRFDGPMLQGLMTLVRHGQAPMITPFILAGAMSPVSMPSAVMQQHAEVLAGVTLAQAIQPGAPVVYGGFVSPLDLQSGATSFGTPEAAWAQYATAQMSRHIGVPLRSVGCLTTAQLADGQAAYESMFSLIPAVQSHTQIITQAAGWLDGGLTAGYEKFILDCELLRLASGLCRKTEVTTESLALPQIDEVGPGGHHLGTDHTMQHFRSAFYRSPLSSRLPYETWRDQGAADLSQRAHLQWQEMLKNYVQPPIDSAVDEALISFMEKRKQEW